MKTMLSCLLAGVILLLPTAVAAQADSAFTISSVANGTALRVNLSGGAFLGGTFAGSGAPIVDGAGTRLMWYPQKAAFRAGYVDGTQWDEVNTGNYSVAIGYDARASADNSMAFGLRATAAQVSSFAAGEDVTASGAASVAMGYHAHTNARQGSFVFADRSTVDSLRAGVNHSANWRVSGGFRIFTASNLTTGVTIQSGASISNWGQSNAVISTSTGAYLSTAGVWTNTSDVNRKHDFLDLSGEQILAALRDLPIRSWSYRTDPAEVRHIGPTAQDFRAAFGLGSDSTAIGTVDADGVALAGVQALERRTREQAEQLTALRQENEALRREQAAQSARLDALQKQLEALAAPITR